MTRASFSLVVAACVAAASFIAALPALRAFDVTFAAGIIFFAAVLSTAITFGVAQGLRQPALVSYASSLLGLVIFLLIVGGPHPGVIATDLAEGPNRVLSEIAPLTGSPSMMALLIALTWLCGTATSEVFIRSRRPAVGFAIPVGLFVVALAATESAPGRYDATGPLLLAVLAALALVRHHYSASLTSVADADGSSTPSRYRSPAVGAACVVVVATSLALAVPALPAMTRPPASLHRAAPTSMEPVNDPLATMAGVRDDTKHGPRTVMTVQFDQVASGYLGMAVLDKYDGATWGFRATFHPTGGRIPPQSSTTVASAEPVVRQQVTVWTRLPVPLLPTLDRPAEVQGASVVTDNSTGMLLPEGNVKLPFTYTVSSNAEVSTLNRLPSAYSLDVVDPDSNDFLMPPNSTPDLATALRFFSEITKQQPKATVGFLRSVLGALQYHDWRIDPYVRQTSSTKSKAKAGKHSHPLTTTTTVPPNAEMGGVSLSEVINAVTIKKSATPEQFATMFAMVARYLGVPARVVTGFRVADSATSGPVAGGTYPVSTRQAWAWVEIPVSGIGWVVADPTPDQVIATSGTPPQNVQAPSTTLPLTQANAVPANEGTGGHALGNPTAVKAGPSSAAPVWLVALIAVAAFVLLLLAAGPGQASARRARRRRSRRSNRPDELAVGAWLELLDDLERAGMEPTGGWTSTEVADEVGLHFGEEHQPSVRAVGALADQAVFSTSPELDLESAQRAWRTQEEAARGVLRSLDRRQRIRALVSVGRGPRLPY